MRIRTTYADAMSPIERHPPTTHLLERVRCVAPRCFDQSSTRAIGTFGATASVILAFRHVDTGFTVLAHVDSFEADVVAMMLKDFPRTTPSKVHLYVSGGAAFLMDCLMSQISKIDGFRPEVVYWRSEGASGSRRQLAVDARTGRCCDCIDEMTFTRKSCIIWSWTTEERMYLMPFRKVHVHRRNNTDYNGIECPQNLGSVRIQ